MSVSLRLNVVCNLLITRISLLEQCIGIIRVFFLYKPCLKNMSPGSLLLYRILGLLTQHVSL